MDGEIITIGNELISGRTRDLNAWYAAGRLTAAGLTVTRITSVGDDPEMVSEAIRKALETAEFLVVTGGLGATEDDKTNEIVAQVLERPLQLNPEILAKIRSYVEAHQIELSPALEKMAWLPDGSKLLHPEGQACGFYLEKKRVRLYFLPGVPEQMRDLMDRIVLPQILRGCTTLPVVRQRILRLYGINEPQIAETFKQLEGSLGEVVIGFYPRFPENHITLSVRGPDETSVVDELDRVEGMIYDLLGDYIFARRDESMEMVVGRILAQKGLRLAVAESCTAGLIAHRLTAVPGSSSYFEGGFIVYSNAAKTRLLGVSADTLSNYGAVSDPTAQEMAANARERLGADLGVAVTGIAGPGGGTRSKPVGTVHVALSSKDEVFSKRYNFRGDREAIRVQTAMMALDWVRRYLHGYPFLLSV